MTHKSRTDGLGDSWDGYASTKPGLKPL